MKEPEGVLAGYDSRRELPAARYVAARLEERTGHR